MAVFSVIIVTAAPPGQASEAGGAYVKVDGREALLRSIELFLNRDNIKQILLVVQNEEVEEARRKHGGHLSFSGVKLVGGGPRWIEQLAAAAEHLKPEATHVVVHDAARPAVPYTDLERLLEEAEQKPVVALAAPVRTSLLELDEGGMPVARHLPEQYLQLLTPQAFSAERFRRMAHEKQDVHPSEVHVVKGSTLNIRIGGTGDATLARAMLNMLPKPKVKGPLSPFEEAQW
jgi:2-C-methyl-D-erythritol 4-phosphate cytidylyltransferase